jgi:hypothetical protein
MEQKGFEPGSSTGDTLHTQRQQYRFPRGIGRSGDRKRKACFGPISKNLVHAGVDEGLSGGPYGLEVENHYLTRASAGIITLSRTTPLLRHLPQSR